MYLTRQKWVGCQWANVNSMLASMVFHYGYFLLFLQDISQSMGNEIIDTMCLIIMYDILKKAMNSHDLIYYNSVWSGNGLVIEPRVETKDEEPSSEADNMGMAKVEKDCPLMLLTTVRNPIRQKCEVTYVENEIFGISQGGSCKYKISSLQSIRQEIEQHSDFLYLYQRTGTISV